MNIGTLTVILTANTTGLARAARSLQQLERTSNASMGALAAGAAAANAATIALGRTLTQFATIPLAILGIAATKTFAEFEFSLAKIEGLVGVARDQTKAWGNEILALSKQIGKGPNELADALYFITSSGFKGAEAMNILNVSAKAAAAGLGETKYVADIVTSAMNAYGQGSLSAARATDILVATIREGKGEANKMVASMGVALPIASKLGVGMEQVGASMAVMTRLGTTVSTSAVQVRQMFNTLIKPAKQSQKAIEEMGSSYEELRNILATKGVQAMLAKVMEVTKGNEAAMARLFPNIRALNGVLELTGANAAEVDAVFRELQNASGSLNSALVAVNETARMKLNKSWAAIQVKLIEFGEYAAQHLIPIIENIIGVIENLGRIIKSLPQGLQDMLGNLVGLAAIIGPLILLFKALGISIVGVSTAFLATPIGAAVAAFVALYYVMDRTVSNFTKASFAQEKYREATRKAGESIIAEEQQIRQLTNLINSNVTSTKDKQQALERLHAISEQHFGDLSEESVQYGVINHRKKQYLDNLVKEAKLKELLIAKEEVHKKQLEKIATQGDQNAWQKVGGFSGIMLSGLPALGKKANILLEDRRDRIALEAMNQEIGMLLSNTSKYQQQLSAIQEVTEGTKASVALKTQGALQELEATLRTNIENLQEALPFIETNLRKSNANQALNTYIKMLDDVQAKKEAVSKLTLVVELDPAELAELEAYHGKLGQIETLNNLLGKSYDYLGARLSAEMAMLEQMTAADALYTDAQVESQAEQVKKTQSLIKWAEEAEEASKKQEEAAQKEIERVAKLKEAYKNYLNEIDAITIKQLALGESFDWQSALLSVYEKRLDDLASGTEDATDSIMKLAESIHLLKSSMMFQETGLMPSLGDAYPEGLKNEKARMMSFANFYKEFDLTGKIPTNALIDVSDRIEQTTKRAKELQDQFDSTGSAVFSMDGIFKSVFSGMADVITNAFESTENVFKQFGKFFGDFIKGLIFKLAAAAIAALVLVTILSMLPGMGIVMGGKLGEITKGGSFLKNMGNAIQFMGASALADGGIVPDGFPNDTYPAWLSSKEAVIPLDRMPQLMDLHSSKSGGKVEFYIEGRYLKGILEDANVMSKTF